MKDRSRLVGSSLLTVTWRFRGGCGREECPGDLLFLTAVKLTFLYQSQFSVAAYVIEPVH
jgi:hypothetical protein